MNKSEVAALSKLKNEVHTLNLRLEVSPPKKPLGFTSIECSDCDVQFCTTIDFLSKRKSDHRTFYCPNGHTLWFAPKK